MASVSVIIPVYNAERYLAECLDSVLGQTLRDTEVICVDDGSTDGSVEILAACAAKDPRIRVLRQPENLGQGAARNWGLEESRGEYTYFMDADDELASADALERLVAEADKVRLDALFFDAETKLDEGLMALPSVIRAEDYIRRHDYSGVLPGRDLFARFLRHREYTVSPCLVLLRREFLEKKGIRFPNERIFYEDDVFMTSVMLSAERTSHRPWRLFLRRVHSGSTVTSTPTMRHLRGYVACCMDVCETLARGGWDWRTRAALRDRYAGYKLGIRRMSDAYPELVAAAKEKMTGREYAELRKVLKYPLHDKVASAFRCFRDRGLKFTVKRILFGRQNEAIGSDSCL